MILISEGILLIKYKLNTHRLDKKYWQHCSNMKDVHQMALVPSVADSRSSVEVVQ
jgi:hypothetical protein